VSRRLVGVFGHGDSATRRRLAGALPSMGATAVDLGPLRVAYTGPPPAAGEELCLLDGCVDNAAEVAAALAHPAPGDDLRACERMLSAGYQRWGSELVARLRGDFLLLIWDAKRGEGLLARDQLGVRCAYLHDDAADALCFASEMHDLLALLPARPRPDTAGVAHWLAISNRPGSHTLFAGIRRLNPGCMLLLDERGARERRYWAPRFIEPTPLPSALLSEQVRDELTRAVARRMPSDGGAVVLMSGGLDSASVAAIASELAPGEVSAYAGVFPDHPAVDESELIAELRDTLALAGVTAEVRSGGLLAGVLDSIAAHGAPPAAWGDFWTLPLLSAAASSGARVALGGDGGDELFAARAYLLADDVRAGRLLTAYAHSLELPGAGARPPRRQVARVIASRGLAGALPYRLHDALSRPFAARGLPPWIGRECARAVVDSDDPLAWKRLDGPRWWAHAAHGLTRGVEEAGLFEHHRRRAIKAGLEARHPLFDLDLVETVLRTTPDASFDRMRNRPLLRQSMSGCLPDSVRLRPAKAWFDSLIVDCLTGADGVAVRRLLTDPHAELRAYVDQRAMQADLFDTRSTEAARGFGWMHQVWRLLTMECWLRSEATGGRRPTLTGGLATTRPRVVLKPAIRQPLERAGQPA
jgi:asparagine synthase (glutamine-hydrolysing)